MSAQFLTIELEIPPQVDANVEQSLNFGSIATNSGVVQFNLGDPSMGIFSIRALSSQRLLVTVDAPDVLRHNELNAQIPINLRLAIANHGVDDYEQAVEIIEYPSETVVQSPESDPDSAWSLVYLYVYGSLTVANVPTGTYSGNVYLNVEYD